MQLGLSMEFEVVVVVLFCHISAGMSSGPVAFFFFMCFTAFLNSSYVSSLPSFVCPCSSGFHSSLAASSVVAENLPARNSCHSSPSSSEDWIMSPFFFLVGCGD